MANKYNWVIATESGSNLIQGNIYYVEESRWTSDKTQATVFPSKAKAEALAKSLNREYTVEKE